jgi:exodeoxyribonuclease VII large subunit
LNAANPIRLSELSAKVTAVIRNAFQASSFWVIADVTNHTFKQNSNYHYFELVEKDTATNTILAKFSAKAWGAGSKELESFERTTGQRFSDNIQVLVNVTIEFHATYGLQLQLIHIDASFTLGVIERQRQDTLEKLVRDNPSFIEKIGEEYLTRNKKLPLGRVIQTIAVISSRSSAGLQDFRHTLENNLFGYFFKVDEYYTGVQGEANAAALRDQLVEIFLSNIPYDAVVITRGGGAQTDFLIFDNYLVGQAIAKFPIPVITGIGHQKNTTIADLMAHTPTKTPTRSAEFIIAHNRTFEEALLNFQKQVLIRSQQLFSSNFQSISHLNSMIVNKSRNILIDHRGRIDQINQVVTGSSKSILYRHKTTLFDISSQLLIRPRILISNKAKDIHNLTSNLRTFYTLYLKNQQGTLEHLASLIKLVSPENTLKRGFTLIKINNKIVSTADGIDAGTEILVVFSLDELKVTVNSKSPHHGNEFDL